MIKTASRFYNCGQAKTPRLIGFSRHANSWRQENENEKAAGASAGLAGVENNERLEDGTKSDERPRGLRTLVKAYGATRELRARADHGLSLSDVRTV